MREASVAPAAVILRPRRDGAAPGVLGYDEARDYRALGRSAVDAAWPRLRAALPWLRAEDRVGFVLLRSPALASRRRVGYILSPWRRISKARCSW